MITIPSGIKDPSYRYKMPKMQLKQESRLNGVKTNIFNIDDVAYHLRVPSMAIMKYMCEMLGANMEQTSIVKGKHTYEVMLMHLDKFINKYVLCKGCNYPEIVMMMDGKDLKSKCNSCGKTNEHDGKSKAGKVFVLGLKKGKTEVQDIVSKDKKKDLTSMVPEDDDEEEKGEDFEIEAADKKKKDKKDKKKDKKKKRDDSD